MVVVNQSVVALLTYMLVIDSNRNIDISGIHFIKRGYWPNSIYHCLKYSSFNDLKGKENQAVFYIFKIRSCSAYLN